MIYLLQCSHSRYLQYLGEGWVLRHIPSRFSSPNDQTPCLVKTIFYSPILKVKFDTEGLAKKFLKCVQDCYGDEAAATHMYAGQKIV